MESVYYYNALKGSIYAQSYSLYDNIPETERLFFYANNIDCTNFISQCVFAAYGGWIAGFSEPIISKNLVRIKNDVCQVKGIWYGSKTNIGSNRWCRVEEFYSYVTDTKKHYGPNAEKTAEGDFNTVDPSQIEVGDIIQFIVTDYNPDRYGHCVFVTSTGSTWDDVTVCCHSVDRLNEPMSWFAQFPEIYKRLRVLKFSDAIFENRE